MLKIEEIFQVISINVNGENIVLWLGKTWGFWNFDPPYCLGNLAAKFSCQMQVLNSEAKNKIWFAARCLLLDFVVSSQRWFTCKLCSFSFCLLLSFCYSHLVVALKSVISGYISLKDPYIFGNKCSICSRVIKLDSVTSKIWRLIWLLWTLYKKFSLPPKKSWQFFP